MGQVKAFEQYGLDPDEYMIELSKEDAKALATNVRCIGTHIIMPECSIELKTKLEKLGYSVEAIEFSKPKAGGGSVHCCTNNLDETYIEGGYHKHPEALEQLMAA